MKKLILSLFLIPLVANSSEKVYCEVISHSASEKISLPEDTNLTSIFIDSEKETDHLYIYTRQDERHDEKDSLEILFDLKRDETDNIHKISCMRLKIKEGALEEVYSWFETLKQREDELYRAYQHEGIFLESFFLEKRSDGDYLIHYSRHDHLNRLHTMVCPPIRLFHFECQEKYTERGSFLKLLFDHVTAPSPKGEGF